MKTLKFILIVGASGFFSFYVVNDVTDSEILSYKLDLERQELLFCWKGSDGKIINSFSNLRNLLELKKRKLVFAMNGGMFNKDFSPQGLYVENGAVLSKLDTAKSGYGNFYLSPNGVFYISLKNEAGICKTEDLGDINEIKFATQSGPLLLINGIIHPKLTKGSRNLHIRNGVGILENGSLLFAMSKSEINFYDFASFFKDSGCNYALYLDGFVSRTYLPKKEWVQLDGQFGVIIAEIE